MKKGECIIKGDVSQYVYMNICIGFGEGMISLGRDIYIGVCE